MRAMDTDPRPRRVRHQQTGNRRPGGHRLAPDRVASDRLRQRRRRAALFGLLGVAGLLLVVDLARGGLGGGSKPGVDPAPLAADAQSSVPSDPSSPEASASSGQTATAASTTVPQSGPGTFGYAAGKGK